MKVKKISSANVEACSLPKLFDEEKIDFQPVQCVNWAEYPYKPKVSFRIAHTKDSICYTSKSEKKVYVPSMEKTMDLYGLIPVWSFSLFRPVTESIII